MNVLIEIDSLYPLKSNNNINRHIPLVLKHKLNAVFEDNVFHLDKITLPVIGGVLSLKKQDIGINDKDIQIYPNNINKVNIKEIKMEYTTVTIFVDLCREDNYEFKDYIINKYGTIKHYN